MRLANCFIRCVLNYAQPPDKEYPFLQYRDERLAYSLNRGNKKYIHAIDDGGIHFYVAENPVQVALLESKRAFKTIVNGVPIISDELLAQMVGEALGLRHGSMERISDSK